MQTLIMVILAETLFITLDRCLLVAYPLFKMFPYMVQEISLAPFYNIILGGLKLERQ